MHLPRLTMTNICKSAPKLSLVSFFFYIFVPIMRKILFIAIIALICGKLSAQNTLSNQFGSSASGTDRDMYDRNGNPIDTTAVNDASTIPIGLTSWKIDARFGNRTEVPVDTLQGLTDIIPIWGTWELPVLLMYFSTGKMSASSSFSTLTITLCYNHKT